MTVSRFRGSVTRSAAGAFLPASRLVPSAARNTSADRDLKLDGRRRSIGPDSPTAATTRPDGSRTGAATPPTLSRHSPRFTAKPDWRTRSISRRNSAGSVIVRGEAARSRRDSASSCASPVQASIALPVATQCAGARPPICVYARTGSRLSSLCT